MSSRIKVRSAISRSAASGGVLGAQAAAPSSNATEIAILFVHCIVRLHHSTRGLSWLRKQVPYSLLGGCHALHSLATECRRARFVIARDGNRGGASFHGRVRLHEAAHHSRQSEGGAVDESALLYPAARAR